jgi:hypothetical protein
MTYNPLPEALHFQRSTLCFRYGPPQPCRQYPNIQRLGLEVRTLAGWTLWLYVASESPPLNVNGISAKV